MLHSVGFVIVVGIFAFVICAPFEVLDPYDSEINVIRNVYKVMPNGSYYYRYHLDNHVTLEVEGILKEVNSAKVYSVSGTYGYPLGDGKNLYVDFVADENGYRVIKIRRFYPPQYAISPNAIKSLLG